MILRDALTQITPRFIAQKLSKKVDFVFLVHARSSKDLRKKYPFLPESEKVLSRVLKAMPIFTAGTIKGVDRSSGIFMAIPLTAKELLEDRSLAVKYVNKAYAFAEKMGARCMGLGGYTGSLTANGTLVKEDGKCKVTLGHTMTVWVVTKNVLDIARLSGMDPKKIKIGIVGGAGSIGHGCYSYLKKRFEKFVLIDKNVQKLEQLVGENGGDIVKTNELSKIKGCNIVIVATSATEMIIGKSMLDFISPGTIFVDDAQPINVDRSIAGGDKHILVLEGGLAHSSEVKYRLNLDTVNDGDFFGCMGEAMLVSVYGEDFARKGRVEYSDIEAIDKLSSKSKIDRAVFQSFGNSISDQDIKKSVSLWT